MITSLESSYTVGIARCTSYDPEVVQEAVDCAIAHAGFLGDFKTPEILLKANLLAPRPPEDAVTTHPTVLRSLVRSFQHSSQECRITIADSPGFIYAHQRDMLFSITGMTAIAQETTCSLALLGDLGFSTVDIPTPFALHQAKIATMYLHAPFVINVAKLKTHIETKISACVKNIFGIADTPTRKRAHESPAPEHLVHAIVDLFSIRPPDFHILDAVDAMEGNGPSRGRPKHLGWVLAGRNGLAIDAVAAYMLGYSDPYQIPLLRVAAERSLGPRSCGEIRLIGASWSELSCPGFRKATTALDKVPRSLRSLAYKLTEIRPHLIPAACTACGICARVCPVDAITITNSMPSIDRQRCVLCLCCHEMCPSGAMTCQPSMLARIVLRT